MSDDLPSSGNMDRQGVMAHRPTFIAHKGQRYLIMDAPTDQNMQAYIQECTKHGVKTIVRACDQSYSTAPFKKAGIEVLEMSFADGEPPPPNIVREWLALCKREFAGGDTQKTIGVHCVAGLGRAPVLVALSLIELDVEPLEAVAMIRKKRRGAINARQIKFLENYKKQAAAGCGCIII